MRLPRIPRISIVWFCAIMSAFNLVCYHVPFFQFAVTHSEAGVLGRVLLIISLVMLVLALNFFACYLLVFLLRYVGRVIVALTHILSATCVYFIFTYHTIIDESMLSNVFNTRYSEASGFFSWGLFLWIFFLGVLPAVYVLVQRIDYGAWKRFGISSGISIGVSLIVVLLNFNQFLWIGKYDTELGGLLMPWSYTVNTGRLMAQHHEANRQEILLPDCTFNNENKTAVVLVIGESARKADFSLYGYERTTNPRLSAQTGLHALEARSCATYTTAGVKAILEYKPQRTLYEILPNYLYRNGVDVVWRTSNWGEPPVHIAEYKTKQSLGKQHNEPAEYDNILFSHLKQRITQSEKDKVFIVLHTSTSHGPCYYAQYPPEFEVFSPVSKDVETGKNDLPGLINAYDNSIVYTDYLLSNLIDTLRSLQDYQTAMLYVSDHGESLGENGLFMHGVPLKMAPREQYEIPFLVWTSSGFRELKEQTKEIEQHSVFHSVLNLFSAESPVYNEDYDIFVKE